MRHDDRMNETEGKTLAQGQGMNVPGETETREEAEMSREKGQDAEEKEAAPEAPQEERRPGRKSAEKRSFSWRRRSWQSWASEP